MLWTVLATSFFLFVGLLSVWLGMYVAHIERSVAPTSEAPPTRRWPLAAIWLWRIAWTTAGLGWSCFSLTALRYTNGSFISVPATAPLVDQVIWIFGIVCVVGSLFLLLGWLAALSGQDSRASREGR